jgi:hypothetical protein
LKNNIKENKEDIMKKCLILYILLSILMVLAAPIANAESIVISYFEDTSILSSAPNNNFIYYDSIFLMNTTNISETGLIKINVSEIPLGANINEGILTYYKRVGGGYITAYQYPDNSWNPYTVTYNNFIRLPTTYLSTTQLPQSNCYPFDIDITNAIKNRNGDHISIILELGPKMIPYSNSVTSLYSADSVFGCYPNIAPLRPFLEVNYTLNNNPTIMVTSPNGGEIWARGTAKTITWISSGNPGTYVKIELLKNGVFNRIITSNTSIGSSGSGSYNWLINSTQIPGADYNISVTSTTNSAYTDTSNNNFVIGGTDILSYYRGLGNDPNVVETTDLLKAADDWSNNIIPPGFASPITTQQLLELADEWSRS